MEHITKGNNPLYKGISYVKRVKAVNEIYDKYIKRGVTNRYIWRTYVYPIYGITERTFYTYLKHGCDE